MTPSLRKTLLYSLGLPLVLLLPVTAGVQYRLAVLPAEDVLDHEISNVTLGLSPYVRYADGAVKFEITPEAEATLRSDEMDSIMYTVLDAQGRPIAGDRELAAARLDLKPGELQMYSTSVGNAGVRVAARGLRCGPGVCQVRAAETSVNRGQIQASVLGTTLAAMLVVAAIAVIGLWIAISIGLKRVTSLSDQLATRSLDDLRPLDGTRVPVELAGVVEAMNRLFERVRSASNAQQAFLADAAHQLRTPLAAMRTEAELALIEPHSSDVHPTLVRLQEAASRASRLSTQLLALARSDPTAAAAVAAELTNLKDIAADAAREWVPRGIAAGADIGFDLEDATIVGRQFQMREMLNNLIHNALEYGGSGVQITVRTHARGERAELEVEDTGPGIPPEEREKVLQRFYRCPGSVGMGSGLGLAIVRDIAASHGAVLTIDSGAGGVGTVVRIAFPLAESPMRGAASPAARAKDPQTV